MTPPEASATTAGRRAVNRPSRLNIAPFGVFCQDFDGQNTFGPSSETTAGTRVIAANAITATAIASPGPRLLNPPKTASSRALNAMMIAPAADAITSPTRATAVTSASFGSLAGAQPLAEAEQQEQDVVGADAVQHDGQDGLQVLGRPAGRTPWRRARSGRARSRVTRPTVRIGRNAATGLR